MLKYKIPQIVTLIHFKTYQPDISAEPQVFKLTRSFCAKKTKILYKYLVEDLCDRDRIQTCNRLIRSQLLYSVELRGLVCFTGAKIRTFFELARDTQTFFEKNYSINR